MLVCARLSSLGAKKIVVCQTCGAAFEHAHGPGATPKFCLAHRSTKNRARDLRRIEAQAGPEAAARASAAAKAVASHSPATRAMGPQLLAIGLGVTDDPGDAAAIVGVVPDDPEHLAELVAIAREQYQGLIDGAQADLGALLHRCLSLTVARTMCDLHRLTPSQGGHLARAIAQTMETVTGGATPAYSKIELVLSDAVLPDA